MCDVVIEGRNWNQMSEDQILTMIRPRVIEALTTLITEAGFDAIPDFLHEETHQAKQEED